MIEDSEPLERCERDPRMCAVVRTGIVQIQRIAQQAGVYAGRAATRLERLHALVIPVVVDLEEEPVLGFTMGRPPGIPPSRERPAYAALHSGTTREQERLAYAYLAAWLFIDGRGCTVPLPPSTSDGLRALPAEEQTPWLQALALLIPPDVARGGHAPGETAGLLQLPEAMLEFYIEAR